MGLVIPGGGGGGGGRGGSCYNSNTSDCKRNPDVLPGEPREPSRRQKYLEVGFPAHFTILASGTILTMRGYDYYRLLIIPNLQCLNHKP